MLRATTTSQLPKVLRSFCASYILTSTCASRHNGVHFFVISTVLPPWCALRILTSKCASCHNGVHFFDISTSKSALNLVCFAHFDFEMCFAPQWRVLFSLTSCHMAPHPPLWRAYFLTLRSHKSLEKHSESRLSNLFAHLHLLSSDLFSSDSSHLCFSTVHIVGSIASKLPSIKLPVVPHKAVAEVSKIGHL